MKVGVRTHFDAAHHDVVLGKAYPLHGHTYTIEVILEKAGTDPVMDFNRLHSLVGAIIAPLNEKNLNDLFDNPTAETIIQYIHAHVKKQAKDCVVTLRLEQGKNQWVEYSQ